MTAYWPEANSSDGIEAEPCPKCGHDGAYVPTQYEVDGIIDFGGHFKCTNEKCGLELPVKPHKVIYEGEG